MSEIFLKQISLLYVEDSRAMREILAKRLEKRVKKLIVAEDGEEGFEKYCQYKPDIILTDIEMPKLNGFELAKKIRQDNKDAIIIVLSAHTDSSFLLDALELNISGYLLKPVDKDKLHHQLEFYARYVYLTKVNQEQQKELDIQKKALQYLLDKQQIMSFIIVENQIYCASNTFLEFFDTTDVSSCVNIKDVFVQNDNYFYPKFFESTNDTADVFIGDLLFGEVNKLEKIKRVVLLQGKATVPKSFLISVSEIDANNHLYGVEFS